MNLKYTLLADGSSDRTLVPIINWTLSQIPDLRVVAQFAEIVPKPSMGLAYRAMAAVSVYECDILFVHREAESLGLDLRLSEIKGALSDLNKPVVPVVPIRMTEAWLLIDELAIRAAASNENGTIPLRLPQLSRLETLTDPKAVLFESLRLASELPAGRLKKFKPEARRHRVSELIANYAALRGLSAFRQFEEDLMTCIQSLRTSR